MKLGHYDVIEDADEAERRRRAALADYKQRLAQDGRGYVMSAEAVRRWYGVDER